jgi:hypothetical protein
MTIKERRLDLLKKYIIKIEGEFFTLCNDFFAPFEGAGQFIDDHTLKVFNITTNQPCTIDIRSSFVFTFSDPANEHPSLLLLKTEDEQFEYNMFVISNFVERAKLFELIVNRASLFNKKIYKTVKESCEKLFTTHKIDDHSTMFCLMFNINPITGSVRLPQFRKTWKMVVAVYSEKAKTKLRSEIEKNAENADDLETLIDVVDQSVSHCYDEIDEITDIEDAMLTWPRVLLPAPEFIVNSNTGRFIYMDLPSSVSKIKDDDSDENEAG